MCAEINKRRVNEALDRGRDSERDDTMFVCECGRIGCNALLRLTVEQYANVRTGFDRFLIARGHAIPEVDEVDETHRGYSVAVKRASAIRLVDDDDRCN